MASAPLKLLLISFYYDPDLSAGSFRMKAFVDALQRLGGGHVDITILTTMPNRYHDMIADCPAFEDHGDLRIHRIALPPHKGGMKDQARAFLTFSRAVMRLSKAGAYDRVFATSSRLMTAVLGAWVAKRLNRPLILDIRDLFTDTMGDIFAKSAMRHGMFVFRALEKRAFRQAQTIIINSPGFRPHVAHVAPKADICVYTNGIDPEFADYDFTSPPAPFPGSVKPVVLYAGNVGEGQGLEKLLPDVAQAMGDQVDLVVVGNGGRMEALKAAVSQIGVQSVRILPPVPREDLCDMYHKASILLVHLNDYPAFRKVIPSKIFEYAATGKPILAGLSGTSADLVRQEIPGSVVFAPCDAQACGVGITNLLSGPAVFDRTSFVKTYDRREISAQMARTVLGHDGP